MPADAVFVESLLNAIRDRGARILEAPDLNPPNPFPLRFDWGGDVMSAIVHVRRTTPQHGAGTDHGRPPGEWHTQMIFDDSVRGAGVRNHLRVEEGYTTVLLGYADVGGAMVVVSWDAGRKAEYAYSRSLQVKDDTLLDALHGGIGQQEVKGGEVVVAFRPEFFPEYLESYHTYHDTIEPTGHTSAVPGADDGERPRNTTGRGVTLPPDFFGPRDRRPTGGTRAIRDVRFRAFIRDHYDACAVCGIRVPTVLEAAHIIPVADERSSDHPSNGICLCRNCHGLYDAGLLAIRPDYTVEVSERLHRLAPNDAAAYEAPEREHLRLPELDPEYRPDPENLRYTYEVRRS